jgi:hypothetical protein
MATSPPVELKAAKAVLRSSLAVDHERLLTKTLVPVKFGSGVESMARGALGALFFKPSAPSLADPSALVLLVAPLSSWHIRLLPWNSVSLKVSTALRASSALSKATSPYPRDLPFLPMTTEALVGGSPAPVKSEVSSSLVHSPVELRERGTGEGDEGRVSGKFSKIAGDAMMRCLDQRAFATYT